MYDFKDVKILLVENSTAMFRLMRDVLVVFGVPERNIFASYSPYEAYSAYKALKPDIVISDWLQEPGLGLELASAIRTDQSSPNPFVPIILTAGSADLRRVIRARDKGVSEYLVKPFSAKTLSDRIMRAIERQRPFVICETFTGPDRRVRTLPIAGAERRVNSPILETVN